MNELRVVVVGTPSAGKSYFSRILRDKIKDAKVIEINDVAKEYHLFSKRKERAGTKTVKLKELERAIRKRTKDKGVWIIVGHLGVEMDFNADMVVVVRSHLKELEKRMRRRRYTTSKMMGNLVSEAIDYSGVKATATCKEVYEISGREMERMAGYIKDRARGTKKRIRFKEKRYLSELIPYIEKYGAV